MMFAEAARRTARMDAGFAWPALGLATLAIAGYAAAADLRIAAVLVGAVALVASAAVACQRPHAALSACFGVVLVAGTKFRMRDASDSLAGSIDAQILFELALFAIVGAVVLAAWVATGDRRRVTRVEVLIGAYAAIALMSTLWSAAPLLTLVRAGQLLVVAAMAAAAVRVLTPSGALWSACASLAVYAVACAVTGPSLEEYVDLEVRTRFAWFSVHPIAVGTLAAIGALGLLSTAFWKPPRHGRLLGIRLHWYAVPLVIVLVLTNSRGPVLAFVAGVCALAFVKVPVRTRVALALAAVASLLVIVAAGPNLQAWLVSASMQDSTFSRALFQGQSADGLLGLNGRLDLWADVAPAMAEHPLLGYGYQASRATLLEVAPWAGYAHNALMQTLLDLGLAGTVVLGLVVVVALSTVLRPGLPPWLRGTAAALMVFLALNSVGTESFAGSPGFETVLLFVCALAAASARSSVVRERLPL